VTVNGLKIRGGSAIMAAMAAKSELLAARSDLPRRVDLRKWMTPVRKSGNEDSESLLGTIFHHGDCALMMMSVDCGPGKERERDECTVAHARRSRCRGGATRALRTLSQAPFLKVHYIVTSPFLKSPLYNDGL
jgi:hypothetical protein